MTHFAYITHILYCTLYKLQTTCLCVKYFVKNLHRAETIYTGGARGARDKYQVCGQKGQHFQILQIRLVGQ